MEDYIDIEQNQLMPSSSLLTAPTSCAGNERWRSSSALVLVIACSIASAGMEAGITEMVR